MGTVRVFRDLLDRVVSEAGVHVDSIVGLGIGVPGVVDGPWGPSPTHPSRTGSSMTCGTC